MKNHEIDNSDLFDGFGNGSLHFYVVSKQNCKPYKDGNARYLELDFHLSDWEAFYVKSLKVPEDEEYQFNENIDSFDERNKRRFQNSIRDFPMLGRIFSMYEDYLFTTQEILSLRYECERLKLELKEKDAIKAVRKLIYASDEAIKAEFNLMFVCD